MLLRAGNLKIREKKIANVFLSHECDASRIFYIVHRSAVHVTGKCTTMLCMLELDGSFFI